ncbi:MAG: hypothetical protein OEW11_11255 [Nitrospirota bacterium]|nr:hypothetical protein [Nitrospirota bacterium]
MATSEALFSIFAGATGTSRVFEIPKSGCGIDLTISVAATVVVKVSNNQTAPDNNAAVTWQPVGTFTVSGAFTVPALFDFARLEISGNTGLVTALLNGRN